LSSYTTGSFIKLQLGLFWPATEFTGLTEDAMWRLVLEVLVENEDSYKLLMTDISIYTANCPESAISLSIPTLSYLRRRYNYSHSHQG
jgi:hypothetical protein